MTGIGGFSGYVEFYSSDRVIRVTNKENRKQLAELAGSPAWVEKARYFWCSVPI